MVSPVFRYTAIVFNPDKQIISPEWKTEKKTLSHLISAGSKTTSRCSEHVIFTQHAHRLIQRT